ncbi:short transient receptor potential channel 4-associated protein-like [Uloborus diversus]|uniref:short transient receptor potential channel 4-associated protein-like n=1 Tax=Uloborus diversus TaxID=327109 RepID=UPI00240A2A85|nr:short transient receptor potential channel 4-associated protein-like [Uloborus diversus]
MNKQFLSENNSSQVVFKYLKQTTIHGQTSAPRVVHQHVLNLVFSEKKDEVEKLSCTARKLERLLHEMHTNEKAVLQVFSNLQTQIQEVSLRDYENVRNSNSDATVLLTRLVIEDTAEVLKKYILAYTFFPKPTAEKYERRILKLKAIALELLHYMCIDFEYLSVNYAENQNFIQALFSYMQYPETCFHACRNLECLLLSRRKILDLSNIENLEEIINNFDVVPLGNFCKILAITLSELDMYEHKTSLYAQTKQKKNENFYVRDINQDIILKVPDILKKLVNLACIKPFVPCFPSANLESERWMQWIDEQFMNEHLFSKDERFIGGITQWASTPYLDRPMASVQIAAELTFRADAVCVLGLLLVGRRRKEVQKELADLRLIPHLSDVFDHFIWRSNAGRDHVRLPGHNFSCECSPEVALKIQVLRLIHSFCDHSDYKHVMLSWSEYSELQSLEDSCKSPSTPLRLNREDMCVGNKGLLTKIVEVMKKESGASTFRFWLSRAIESYLRGSFSSADQDFLLRRNLLQHIVQNLISSNNRHKEVLQSSFDLLGELIKFNVNAFQELNNHMHSNARRKLENLMNINLVDSNMFIRSLILSYELFATSDDIDLKAFAENHCYLLSRVSLVKTRVHYLKKLLSVITIQNLTQENVSCLNTALVILMFGLKKEELPQYLQILVSNTQEACSVAMSDRTGPLDNLRDLLLFWQDHYLQKDKDCTILERSSRICFQEWRDTVTVLTSEDSTNPNAISFYTKPSVSSRAC